MKSIGINKQELNINLNKHFVMRTTMNERRNNSVIFMAALIVCLASSASAILPRIEFEPIGPVTVDVGDIDIFALITEGDPCQVIFEFHNESQMQSAISSIYFEDNGFDGVGDIQFVEGVFFGKDKKPANFPGGGELDSIFETAFSIGAEPPPVSNGIGPGEQLIVTVDLDYGTSYSDIISGLSDGSIRIGMHVIGLYDGSSFSVLNEEIPEPGTLVLLGLGGMSLVRRRRT